MARPAYGEPNGRHMAQTAAHLADRVIPPVPVRQWVIFVPKRLRGFLTDRPADLKQARGVCAQPQAQVGRDGT